MTTGLDVFDTTLQQTNLWLKELMNRLGTEDRRLACRALSATLHAVRDGIGPESAAHPGAQLPMLIHGIYYEVWNLARTPRKERHKEEFLDYANGEIFGGLGVDPEQAVQAGFEVMCDKLDPGEIEKVTKLFPAELRSLWPVARNVGTSR
jgi:uncharacterized protein (DUF2267 family)